MNQRHRGGGIRRLRVKAGLTQEELVGVTGMDVDKEISLRTIRRYEQEKTNGDETHQRLSDALCSQECFACLSREEFDRLVNYEAGIAHIVIDAIQACEAEGIPIIDQILGSEIKKAEQSSVSDEQETKDGIPRRVVQCSEALEKRIEASTGDDRDLADDALAKAFASDLLMFRYRPIDGQNGLSTVQANVLARLVGALGVGFIKPCSLDLSQSLLQVKEVEKGWLMHLVFNTHRGHAVTLRLDWTSTPPSLLRPDCSFQIPQPDSAGDKRSTDRKTLIQANRIAPGYTMGKEWAEESIDTLDALDWRSAFFGVNQALLARESLADAPFADAPAGKLYGPYIKHLQGRSRLSGLKVIKAESKRSRRSSIVLKDGITEMHVHSFFQNCLQAIKEGRLTKDVDKWLEDQDADKVIARLLTELSDRDDLQESDKARDELKEVQVSPDRRVALRDWIVTWAGRASQAGSHIRNFETVGGWIMETLGMGVP